MKDRPQKIRLLVVEDQKRTLESLQRGLREQGYQVDSESNGPAGLERARRGQYHALLLDLGLPGMDGLELLRTLRSEGRRLPVLALTARDSVESRVAGLDSGADDYMVKPFSFDELCARLRSLLRRAESAPVGPLIFGDLEISPGDSRVLRGGVLVDLTRREFSLLLLLARSPGRPVSRTEMMEKVWNLHFDTDTNIVDVAISRLRDKLEPAGMPALIRSVRGVGYQWAGSAP